MDEERVKEALLWLRVKHPAALFDEPDAREFLERLDQRYRLKGSARKRGALDIARRMATAKANRARKTHGSVSVGRGRNLPTVSDKVPKVNPIPKPASMAQNPNAGKPSWHSTSPGGSIDGKGPAKTPSMKGAYGRSRYGGGR